MKDKIRFFLNRMTERLWVKPLVVSLLSIAVALVAQSVDQLAIFQKIPIEIEKLRSVSKFALLQDSRETSVVDG